MRRRNRLIFAAVLTLVLALAVAVPAFAATESTDGTTQTCTEAGPLGPRQGGQFGVGGKMSAAIAKALGIEAEALEEARQSGKSLANIAEAQGVDKDVLLGAMMEVHRAALDEAVAEGRITQERADAMLERMRERATDRIDDTQTGPFGGRGHGARGERGERGALGDCTGTPEDGGGWRGGSPTSDTQL